MIEQSVARAVLDVNMPRACSSLPTISILIKALNEEAKIGRCIESALTALRELENPSEIILADSVSTDDTVEVAQRYPIKIIQFLRARDRGCGAGVQLGYQHSIGDFVMLLDGDMELLPGFLPIALAKLATEPGLAGVAGLVEETSIFNLQDRHRIAKGASNRPLRAARCLNGGGLYRRAAIAAAGGYAANRNLKAWEEAELGMRLTTAGWKLERIDYVSTRHEGHARSAANLLSAAWRSRRAMANGVLLKQAAGKPWMLKALVLMKHPILVILMWAGTIAALGLGLATHGWEWLTSYVTILFGLFVVFALYKRSLMQAFLSLGQWHYMAAALLVGLWEPIVEPTAPIGGIDLSTHSRA